MLHSKSDKTMKNEIFIEENFKQKDPPGTHNALSTTVPKTLLRISENFLVELESNS